MSKRAYWQNMNDEVNAQKRRYAHVAYPWVHVGHMTEAKFKRVMKLMKYLNRASNFYYRMK